MAETPEYRTVVSCMKQLETALFKCGRDITHFLLQEGFITTEVHHEVLSPVSTWTAHQKAGMLVSGIMRKVALSAQDYHTLVNHLGQSGKHYESIVAILNKEYTRQQQAGDTMQAQGLRNSVPKMSYAFSRYREYLKSYYRSNSIAYDDKLFIAPCSEFISLALVEKEKSSHDDFSKSTFHGNLDEIVAAKTPLEIDDLFESDFRFILVEGPPGVGKSTLCWELCRKWDSELFMQDFKIALHLKLREERVQNAEELHDLFYHEDKKLSQSVVDEVLKCEGEGVLLILDGFDEMPTSVVRNKNCLIMKLLNCRAMPKATRLVTSRPSALHHKAKFPRNYRHVEILGFTDDSKIKYVKIAFENNPKLFTHFKSFVVSNPIIKSLMYIPINCAIIAQVYQDISSSRTVLLPKTMTQLYTILSLVLIRRHKINTGEWDEESEVPSKFGDLSEEILADLKRVGELAYRGLFAEQLQLVFSASDAGKGFNHLGLMSDAREMYVASGAKVTYSFFHLSMQEFLAAWHASCHSELITHARINYFDKLNQYLQNWHLPAHLNAYVKFLAGLVGLSKVLSKPINALSEITLLHCFFEAQNPVQNQKLFESKLYMFIHNSLDAYVIGYVLTHATVKWFLSTDTQNMGALQASLCYHSNDYHIDGTIHALSLPTEGSKHLQHVYQLQLKVRDFIGIESTAALVSAMCRLSDVQISIHYEAQQGFQGDYMLFKALQTLQTLTKVTFIFNWYTMTDKGVNELITFFQKNNTLEEIQLKYYNNSRFMKLVRTDTLTFENNYHPIIESILSCPTLRTFETNIPFVTSKFPSNLNHVHFYISEYAVYTVTALQRCICCIAVLCADSSVKIFSIFSDFSIISEVYHEILSTLNKSLHSTVADFQVYLYIRHGNILSSISVLSRSLSSDFKSQQSHIRRSKSLCDLATPLDNFKKEPVSKSQSCPDLFDLQRLHTLHPQLYQEIFKDSLNFNKDRPKAKKWLDESLPRERKKCIIS